jgi:hypothetical protein
MTAHRQLEGAELCIRQPFWGELSLTAAETFLLLDQAGPHVNGPGEAKGAPRHRHRGIACSAATEVDREDAGVTRSLAAETGGVLVGEKVLIELDVQAIGTPRV